MLTEVGTTLFAIKVNGQTIVHNIPSRLLAEATLFNLPPEQRALAEIVVVTSDGRSVLLG
jgi:hypothetical protein